jgi:hypothetical protein
LVGIAGALVYAIAGFFQRRIASTNSSPNN